MTIVLWLTEGVVRHFRFRQVYRGKPVYMEVA